MAGPASSPLRAPAPVAGHGWRTGGLMPALALLAVGCSHSEEDPGSGAVDVNAAAAQGQSDIDNYAAGRAITVRPSRESDVSHLQAGDAVRRYAALLDAGRYGEAWRSWESDGRGSGMSERRFAQRFARLARVGIEIDRAGTVIRDDRAVVPVVLRATLASGRRLTKGGTITLRRVARAAGRGGGGEAADREDGWRIVAATL